ncbi:hypothetical protein [Dyella sp. 20L07]|uniref:hypothetical protein n=1 Tax=Dyella sp. 20L07 TaxID=3384240 RepID=UPI003D29A1EA
MAAKSDPASKLVPNDVDTFASYVDGVDPSRYFDSQARDVLLVARQRWPLIAFLLCGEGDS